LRRISAPLPVTAAQVREQVRLSLCFRSVADSAVAVEDALGYLHHLIVRLQLWQGLRADVVADLPELVSETVVVHLHLVALGPCQRATEGTQARVEHQVDHRKNHGSEYQPEPPDRRRRRAFPQVLIPYRLRIRVAAVVAQEVDTQHQPAKTHEADNRQ